MPDPTELIAAVLTAWAVSSLMGDVGIPPVPSALTAMLVFAVVSGTYRARWLPPVADGGRSDPGA